MSDVQAETVIETPAPAPNAEQAPPETAAEETAAPIEGETEGEEKPERTFTQAELDKIVQREKASAHRRAERLARAEVERDHYRSQVEQQRAPQVQAQGEPQPKDFKTWEEYNAAVVDYKVNQRFDSLQRETSAKQQERAATEYADRVRTNLQTFAREHPDFEDVALSPDLPITPPMAAAIAESDKSGQIAYYLGQNPDEAERISRLPPTRQAAAIVNLESKFEAAPNKQTTAPAPAKPVAAGSTSTSLKNLSAEQIAKMPMDKYMAMRAKEGAKWAKRS